MSTGATRPEIICDYLLFDFLQREDKTSYSKAAIKLLKSLGVRKIDHPGTKHKHIYNIGKYEFISALNGSYRNTI